MFFLFYLDVGFSFRLLSRLSERLRVLEGSSDQRISMNAFNGCSNLRFITIPESVTEFGSYAFNNCTALTQVRVKWDTPLEIGDADPFPIRADITLLVPPHTSDAYRNAPYWQDFFQIREDEPAWLTYTDENADIYQYEPGYSAQLYRYADKNGRTTFVMPESITVEGVSYLVTAIARNSASAKV